MSELPKGWSLVKLENVVDKIVGGGTPSKSQPSYFTGEIPWMTVKDMNKTFLTDTVDHITQEAVENSSTNIIPAGVPIIATRMSLGKIIRASFDSAINQDLKALFINQEVNQYYFENWYRSQGMKIEALGTGTTVKGIRLEVLKDLDFPLAPLAEQKRIVEKLDQVLAQVDTIKVRLDGIPPILKRFRQSVLAAAVSGKLSGGTDNWNYIKLKDCFDCIDGDRGPNYPKKEDYLSDGYCLFLSTKNVRQFGFDFSNIVYISAEKDKVLRRGRLDRGDLIITTRGTLGYVASYDNSVSFDVVRINSGMLILRKKNQDYLNDYFKILIASPSFQKLIDTQRTGSAQPQLPANILKEFELPVPLFEEQTEIVRLVDQYFAFADTIEKQVQKAQQRVDKLTQSILAKAFRGELVPQDPTDEPADELLKRIAAARAESEALALSAKKIAKKVGNKTTK